MNITELVTCPKCQTKFEPDWISMDNARANTLCDRSPENMVLLDVEAWPKCTNCGVSVHVNFDVEWMPCAINIEVVEDDE